MKSRWGLIRIIETCEIHTHNHSTTATHLRFSCADRVAVNSRMSKKAHDITSSVDGSAVRYKVYEEKNRKAKIKLCVRFDADNPKPEREWEQIRDDGDPEVAVRKKARELLSDSAAAVGHRLQQWGSPHRSGGCARAQPRSGGLRLAGSMETTTTTTASTAGDAGELSVRSEPTVAGWRHRRRFFVVSFACTAALEGGVLRA